MKMIWIIIGLGLAGFVTTEIVRYLVKNGWTKKLTGTLEGKLQLDIRLGLILAPGRLASR